MSDEQLEKWLETLDAEDLNDLRIDLNGMEPRLDEAALDRMKKRAREKLNTSATVSFVKRKRYWSLKSIAAIFIVCLIPLTALAVQYAYHYIPQLGQIVESKHPIYILNEEQVVNHSTLKSVVFESGRTVQATINIQYGDKKIKPTVEMELIKPTIWINEMAYEGEAVGLTQSETEVTITVEFIKQIPEYHLNDHLTLMVDLGNGESFMYELNLESSVNGETFDSLGITDVKKEISLTAITKEQENELIVTLVTPSTNQQQVLAYGSSAFEESGIYLKDAHGNQVNGNLVFYHDRANEYTFNTEGLQKPYHLVVPSMVVRRFNLGNEDIYTLKLPKYGETIEQQTPLDIEGFNVLIESMTLTEGEKDENGNWLNEGDHFQLIVQLNLGEATNKDERLLSFSFQEPKSTLFSFNPLFDGYGATYNEFYQYEELIIFLKREASTLDFKVSDLEVEINGEWEFLIE